MYRVNVFHDIYKRMDTDDLHARKPHMIDVELTNHCNLNCKMCARQLMTRPQGYMDDETYYSIMNQAWKNHLPIRFIRWGEPFLHPNIMEYASETKEWNIPLHITTNGTLLNEKIIKELIDIELDSIIFSMQGTNKEEYEATRINGNYLKLTKNIHDFYRFRGVNRKPYMTITTTINNGQGKDSEQFVHQWDLKVDEVKIGRTITSFLDDKIIPNDLHKPCYEPYRQLSVNWNGDVTACCGDYDGLLVVGNVHDQSLMDIWRSNHVLHGIRSIFDERFYSHLSLCGRCGFGSIEQKS